MTQVREEDADGHMYEIIFLAASTVDPEVWKSLSKSSKNLILDSLERAYVNGVADDYSNFWMETYMKILEKMFKWKWEGNLPTRGLKLHWQLIKARERTRQ